MSISIIGGGQSGGSASTGDITFSGVQIIGAGTASGDGNGYSTIEIVPDADLTGAHQYLVVDPTQPNHIHIRAGGPIDGSNAELILGGEHAHVRVVDSGHSVTVRASSGGNTQTLELGPMAYIPCHTTSYVYLPPGSTLTHEGVDYTVAQCTQDPETTNWAVWLSPAPYGDTGYPFPISGEHEVAIPYVDRDLTFSSDGIHFPDGSVQSVAGVPFSRSWGLLNGGSTVFADDSLQITRKDDYAGWLGYVNISTPTSGPDGEAYGALTLFGGFNGAQRTMYVSALSGITFPDGTTQATAGVVSPELGFASYGRVTGIVKLTQADYDSLLSSNVTDPNTVYVIVG